MAKIQDVAQAAHVSVATVARAFRTDGVINQETRKRVLDAAEQLGYYPNLLARSLKSQKNKMVGIIGHIDTPFYVNILIGLDRELQENGYQLLVGTSNHTLKTEKNYLEMMAGSLVSGIILTPYFLDVNPAVEQLFKKGIPIVQLFNHPYDYYDSVVIDDEQGAYLAASALLDRGHRRIVLFDVSVKFACQRSAGYRKAFAERGLPVDESLIVITPDENIPAVLEAIKPSAVITGVHNQGKYVLQYVSNNGLRLPEDMSVIMFDNVEWMEMMGIDTIAQPIDRVGKEATRLLFERIGGASHRPEAIVLEPSYIARRTVGDCPAAFHV